MRFAASSTVSTRCTWDSMTRPRASEDSSGHAGTVSVQYVAADEHHRRDRGLVGVEVLAAVLEDLLDGAADAGQEHDPGVADLEQDRLAGGVAEVLRDRGREDVRRLVPVVPGGDAQRRRCRRASRSRTSKAASAQASTDGSVAPAPRARRASACVEVVGGRGRRGGRRGWRPPSPRDRRRWSPRARPRAAGRAGPRRRTPARRAAARGRPSRRPGAAAAPSRPGPCRSRGRAGPGRAWPPGRRCSARPGVGAGVEGGGVRRRVVQLPGGVERRAVRVDRDVRDGRQDDAAPGVDPLGVALGEGAAEERSPPRPAAREVLAASRQVEASAPTSPTWSWRRRRSGGRAPPSDSTSTTRPRLCLTAGNLRRRALRRRAPPAPRTARARRPRGPCRGTTCRRWCSRASGSPSRPRCRRGRRSAAGR